MALDWMKFDYTAHGGQGHDDGGGFGSADLRAMQAQGYTPNQIKILANLAPSQGVKVYKPVQQYAESVAKPPWQYGAHGDAAFGIKDINAAQKMPGVSYQTIKDYAKFATDQGIGVHQGAKDWLTNNDPVKLGANKTPGGDWMNFDSNAVGGPGIGVKDIDKMQSEGYSPEQIRILSNTASDKEVKVHSGASDWVKENTEKLPWQYGAHGAEHFGIADIDAALGQGADYNTIKGYADFATETGIGVGSTAGGWIQNEIAKQTQIDIAAEVEQTQIALAAEAERTKKANAEALQATMQKNASAAEYGRLASMRGGGSNTLSISGAATFKGKGLTTSENRRGKGRGTAQFKRPYSTSNLSIAATGKGNQQSTLNL